jgi:hypothetical protein
MDFSSPTLGLRRFTGSEIGRSIVAAIEALPEGTEIVEFSTGENMPIVLLLVLPEDESTHPNFQHYSWDGERWVEIGD